MNIKKFELHQNKLVFNVDGNFSVKSLFAVSPNGDRYPLEFLKTNDQHIFHVIWENIPDYGAYKLQALTISGEIDFTVNSQTLIKFGESDGTFGWDQANDDVFFIHSLRTAMSQRTRDLVVLGMRIENEIVSIQVPEEVVWKDPKLLIRNQVKGSAYQVIPSKIKNSTVTFDLNNFESKINDKFFVFLQNKGVEYRLYNHRGADTGSLVFRQNDLITAELYYTINKRLGIRIGIPRVDISSYETFSATKISVNEQDIVVRIQLSNQLVSRARDVVYFDSQNFLEPFKSFPQYHIKDNVLVLDFKSMPVAGKILVLIKTDTNYVVILNPSGNNFFQQWKTLAGSTGELLITPKSNGLIRPKRRQILVKKVSINDKSIILDIPNIDIDDVILTNETENRVSFVDHTAQTGQLTIQSNSFSSVEGLSYKLFILSEGIRYQLFYPRSVLQSEFSRYFQVGDKKYFYFSKFGYLKYTWLTVNQESHLYSNREFYVNEIHISGDSVKINFVQSPNLLDGDAIVARRYNELILFDYEVEDNILTLRLNAKANSMARGFGYPLEIMHWVGENISYTSLILKTLISDSIGNNHVQEQKLNLTGGNPIELLSEKHLKVIGVIENGLFFIKSLDDIIRIDKVMAEYKERPVYKDITEGVDLNSLKSKYRKLRLVYRVSSKIYATNVSIDTVLNELFV